MSGTFQPAAGSMALSGARGTHPALKLDSFMRSTDAGYQHAEVPTAGDRFIRKMATYGQVRPSVSFTSGPRVSRPFKDHGAIDMSNMPYTWNDPRGDLREYSLEIKPPPKDVDTEFIKLYKNHSLMLPSERWKEHLKMKEAEKQWHIDRETIFKYKRRINVLERKHQEGIVGVDGPTFPETQLYADRHAHLAAQEERSQNHAQRRFEYLAERKRAEDAVTNKDWGSDPNLPRSQDICIQRKCVDPETHPFRFLNTHERLFPTYVPAWDPDRAAALRSHDVRDRRHNILNGADNAVSYSVAPKWEDQAQKLMMPGYSSSMATGGH